jgi:hypothetical protein
MAIKSTDIKTHKPTTIKAFNGSKQSAYKAAFTRTHQPAYNETY